MAEFSDGDFAKTKFKASDKCTSAFSTQTVFDRSVAAAHVISLSTHQSERSNVDTSDVDFQNKRISLSTVLRVASFRVILLSWRVQCVCVCFVVKRCTDSQ